MFRWFVNWLIGWSDYRVSPECARCVAGMLVSSGLQVELRSEDGWLCFSLSRPEGKNFEKLLAARGIEYKATGHGAGKVIKRYRNRPGILIGLALFFLMISLSRNYVWDITVEGNKKVSGGEVIAELGELGFREGTYIKGVDFDKLHSEFLQADRRFAWIAVNMFGTHATVEVREAMRPAPVPDEETPHNLVATESGVIESLEIYRGTKQVNVGDPVREGDLLVAGLAETKFGNMLVHARGIVKASVMRDVRVEVPLEREVKEYTGREFRESSIKILGISLKIFKSTGNPPSNCDIIYRERKLSVFGVLELPMTLCEKVSREYIYTRETLTEEEAKSEAFRRFRSECSELDGELAGREVSAGLDGGVYVINGRLRVIVDIGRECEIYR